MILDVLTLLFLVTIALELGWIIRNTHLKSKTQSKSSMSDVMERVITAQESLTSITQDLTAKLPGPGEGGSSSRTSDTKELQQIQVKTAQLLGVLQEVSVSVSKAQSVQSSSSAELSDRITTVLDQTCSRMDKSLTQVMTQLRNDREQFLKVLKSQSDSQSADSQALNSLLLDVLTEVRSPAKGTQSRQTLPDEPSLPVARSLKSVTPLAITPLSANNHVAPATKASTPSSTPPPAVTGSSASDSPEFEAFQNWVYANLSQIMNRSLNQWNKPEELFRGAPCKNGYTARLIDPDSKLVLAGVNDTSQYLVIALPGGYIDPRYYEWFNLPKGIGARVERTTTPAIVETTDLGFRVLQRGLITQD